MLFFFVFLFLHNLFVKISLIGNYAIQISCSQAKHVGLNKSLTNGQNFVFFAIIFACFLPQLWFYINKGVLFLGSVKQFTCIN